MLGMRGQDVQERLEELESRPERIPEKFVSVQAVASVGSKVIRIYGIDSTTLSVAQAQDCIESGKVPTNQAHSLRLCDDNKHDIEMFLSILALLRDDVWNVYESMPTISHYQRSKAIR
jgi:hypothetical protein